MESLRQQALQAELKRLEEEAEAKSYAIMNKADALAAAHAFCARINAHVNQPGLFAPYVVYYSAGCDVYVYPGRDSPLFLDACTALGVIWAVEKRSYADHHHISLDGAGGLSAIVPDAFLQLAEAA